MPRQGVYAIGIQHHGNFQIGQQGQDKFLRLRGFHGMAGDLCARKLGEYAMLPTDLIETLPER